MNQEERIRGRENRAGQDRIGLDSIVDEVILSYL